MSIPFTCGHCADLVKRLRKMMDMTTTDNDLLDIGRAADRIEHLQARLDSEIANCEWQRGERDQRITELEAQNAALKEQWKEVEGRLMNDIAELRADAERYRWLRNPTHADVFVCPTDTCEALDLEELDAAIDAARKEEK